MTSIPEWPATDPAVERHALSDLVEEDAADAVETENKTWPPPSLETKTA